MPVRYTPVHWEDAPSENTPINAGNLNHMDNGILALSQAYDDDYDAVRSELHNLDQETRSQIAGIEGEVTAAKNGIPGIVDSAIDSKFEGEIGTSVTSWLTEHVDPVGSAVVVDDTLSISGAAADAEKTGTLIRKNAWTGVCSTGMTTQDKVINLDDVTGFIDGVYGTNILVNFLAPNKNTSPRLKVGSGMAYPVAYPISESPYYQIMDAEHSTWGLGVKRFMFMENCWLLMNPDFVHTDVAVDEINDLKIDLSDVNSAIGYEVQETDLPLSSETGGFTGDIEETIQFTTTAQWKRVSFEPEQDTTYKMVFGTRANISATYYIYTVDENQKILGRYGNVETSSSRQTITVIMSFSQNVSAVWVRAEANYTLTVAKQEKHSAYIRGIESDLENIKETIFDNIPIKRSIWEQGTISAATGGDSSSNNVIRTISTLPIDFIDIHAKTGYEFNVYGWSGNTYLGYYNGTKFKTTGSALTYYATKRSASDLLQAGADSVRITARKTGGGTAVAPSEGVNIENRYGMVYHINSRVNDIQATLNRCDSPYQHGIFDIRRNNFTGWYSGLQTSYSDFGENTKYADVIDAFDALMTAYPDYITKNTLGTASGTDEGGNQYAIYEYVFKPKRKTSPYFTQKMPKIFMDGSIHGFEKNSTFGLYYFLKDLAEQWNKNPIIGAIRSQVEIHVIPVSNPYGFDRNDYLNGNGVNINRNFSHPGEWTVIIEPSTEVNGLEAFDQPESAIIRDWLVASENDILMYFNCHTNGNITNGYDEMNPCMTANDKNDPYFDKIIGVFTNHIEEQTLRFPDMYPEIQPSSSEMLGMITTSQSSTATKGTASSYANTMRKIISMTLEMFNGLRDGSNNTIVGKYSETSKKICSEIIGNIVLQVLAEYSPY